MRYKIAAKTFNGITIEPEIEIYVMLGKKNDTLPLGIYSEVEAKLQNHLGINDISYYVISKDLETLESKNIQIDYNSLIDIVYKLALEAAENNIDRTLKNPKLIRVIALYDDRKFADATTLYTEINKTTLTKYENEEYILLGFKLFKEKNQEKFEELQRLFINNPLRTKQLYFEYIKHLEDLRDETKPTQLLNEFVSKYPLALLSQDELTLYYYLQGRSYYARGEFLLALKNLALAKENTNQENERLLASIYNTATNSFTDNLFFDEAEQLAKKALHLREKLKLPETQESIRLIGGIYFKSTQYKKAYNQYKNGHNDVSKNSRELNYLAKSALMAGFIHKAHEYMTKSSDLDDPKGFLVLIKFQMLFEEQKHDEMFELYKMTIMLPENKIKYDKFVLGWGYALMAETSFKDMHYDDGIEYLYKGIDYFMEDKYILELFYIHLYIYKYDLPKEFILKFEELINTLNIRNCFKEYVQKHTIIAEEYAEIFEIEPKGKNNLQIFYDDTKDIDTENYNPEFIRDILANYTLI
jgi:hypothetical protein